MTAVITYDAGTGSDTAPSDTDGSGTNGDWSGTTVTLNETVDFTGVAGDGTDYAWIDTPAGSRKLARVTAFNPSIAACTSLTTAESSTASYTADNWYVNGTRATPDNDTSNPDADDWNAGWVITFNGGTYSSSVAWTVGGNNTFTMDDTPITIQAGTGARPVLEWTANVNMLSVANNSTSLWTGLKFNAGTGHGANTYILLGTTRSAVFEDCVFDGGGTADQCILTSGARSSFAFYGCHFTGGADSGIHTTMARGGCTIESCVFDGTAGTDFAKAGVLIAAQEGSVFVRNCLIFESDLDGIQIEQPPASDFPRVDISGCTLVDNAGCGIDTISSASANLGLITVRNCILAYNGEYGVKDATGQAFTWVCDYNAVYSNTSGAYNGEPSAGANDITLTADPFTNRASDDYTLNNTAGAGAALRNAAYPADLPDGT